MESTLSSSPQAHINLHRCLLVSGPGVLADVYRLLLSPPACVEPAPDFDQDYPNLSCFFRVRRWL